MRLNQIERIRTIKRIHYNLKKLGYTENETLRFIGITKPVLKKALKTELIEAN